ncbi:acyl carrier protein [Chloroherpeton thalassium ATCC 35110]|uniref:Acyl carrier protein n=1 Tax=Chloroherpeton thalassium (strain ATCC 35110 / GB-78) TaxID=517418 RepID=B3QU40_CHLT3|nr:acyl carrier protein [Chloroherpeton thalassium]ACF12838.1 acyl carrier protein [Chloroherpeton thalassium ATCC 35110]
MDRPTILSNIKQILERQGKAVEQLQEDSQLRDISFRSLDFSELCLRVEEEIGRELNFDAVVLRGIHTVKDVCNFIEKSISLTNRESTTQ